MRGASAPLFLLPVPAWVVSSRGDWAPAPPPLSRARCAALGTSKVCGPALPLRGCGLIPTSRLRALRGGPPAPAGRGCPGRVARCAPVARRSVSAAAALRSSRGRRSLRGSPCACFPAAPWVAALPVRSLGGAVAVARRARAAAPGFARPCRGRPPGPASPPRLAPPLAPAGGLRGSRAVALVGRAGGVPPPGVGSSCGGRGGAPAGAGLGFRWLRSSRGRRSLRGSPCACFPAAPWVAALPVRSLGGAVAVARRARAAAPGFARPCRGRPPGPASPPRLAPPLAPAGGLRGSRAVALVGRAGGVPPPGVGSSCGGRGGAPAGAGLGFRWLRPAGDGRPLSRAGKVTSSRRFPYKYGDDIL